MKKFLSLITALVMVCSLSIPALADDKAQPVTTEKKAPTYDIKIPAAVEVPWGKTDGIDLGKVEITFDQNWIDSYAETCVHLQANGTNDNNFINGESKVPYKFSMKNDSKHLDASVNILDDFLSKSSWSSSNIYMFVDSASWKGNKAVGKYTTTINYVISVSESNAPLDPEIPPLD